MDNPPGNLQLTEASPRGPLQRLELRCPPLPQTLLEAMELIEQPERLEVGPVTEMVERDPIVIARLLHIVNSSYYGLRHTVGSAERAVVMLGPVAVAGIVVGMNMLKLRAALDGAAIGCFRRLIGHSVATAFLTRHILEGSPTDRAEGSPPPPARLGVGFTAGMLHDFGKIILVYNFPQIAVDFYDRKALEGQVQETDLRELEQLLFGCDHCEAGEYVARKLSFPDVLVQIIAGHHDLPHPATDADTSRLSRVVAAANRTSSAFGYGFTGSATFESCAVDPIIEELVRQDLPQIGSARALVNALENEKEHLRQYVHYMSSPADRRLDAPPSRVVSA